MILIILTLILCIIIFAITLYNQKFNFISIKLKNITERINSSLIKRKKLLEDSEQIIKSECNIGYSYFYCNEFYGASRKPKVLGKEMQLMYKDRDFAADILADIIVSGDNHYSSTEEIRIMTYTRLSDMKEHSVIWGLFD